MVHRRQIRTRVLASLLAVLFASLVRSVAASTVVPMSVATMSDYAAQVIVADIGETKAYWADQPRRIESRVELRNIEYLKGGYESAPTSRTLIVPGGQIGRQQMRICCAPAFTTGERWILFLLADYKTFPTVAIGQGAFRIVKAPNGSGHVYQHGGLPVSGINDATWIEYATTPSAHAHGQLAGASSNLRLVDRSKATIARTMTFDAFRAAIQPVLDKSRDFGLSRPAGNRVLVTYRPVPIRAASDPTNDDSSRPARPMRTPREATPTRQRTPASNESKKASDAREWETPGAIEDSNPHADAGSEVKR